MTARPPRRARGRWVPQRWCRERSRRPRTSRPPRDCRCTFGPSGGRRSGRSLPPPPPGWSDSASRRASRRPRPARGRALRPPGGGGRVRWSPDRGPSRRQPAARRAQEVAVGAGGVAGPAANDVVAAPATSGGGAAAVARVVAIAPADPGVARAAVDLYVVHPPGCVHAQAVVASAAEDDDLHV